MYWLILDGEENRNPKSESSFLFLDQLEMGHGFLCIVIFIIDRTTDCHNHEVPFPCAIVISRPKIDASFRKCFGGTAHHRLKLLYGRQTMSRMLSQFGWDIIPIYNAKITGPDEFVCCHSLSP